MFVSLWLCRILIRLFLCLKYRRVNPIETFLSLYAQVGVSHRHHLCQVSVFTGSLIFAFLVLHRNKMWFRPRTSFLSKVVLTSPQPGQCPPPLPLSGSSSQKGISSPLCGCISGLESLSLIASSEIIILYSGWTLQGYTSFLLHHPRWLRLTIMQMYGL